MNKGPNPKTFMALALAALVGGGGLCFWGYSGMSEKQAQLEKLRADSKDEKTLQKDVIESKAKLDETAAKLKHLEESVPDFAYVPTMLAELEKAGKANGIDVIGVRPMPAPVQPKKEEGEKVQRKAYDQLDIEVKGRGNYRSVMNFVKALSAFPKIVAARTIDLTPKNDPSQAVGTLDVTIQLRAFVFAAPTPATAPGKQAPKTDVKTAQLEGTSHAG